VTPATAAPSAASATPAAPAEEALPPLAVLDPSMRSSLPPMKLSMHVYNIDPARRFAILDGQRVTEGSQIGAAIVLEIRRDGVVLDVAGKRVLLPRP
jgi:general secretion pathway protein B